MTVLEALREATVRLAEAGVDSPAQDAEQLLRHVLGWDRARLIADGAKALAPEDRAALWALVEQRAKRRPLQHLTGRQWFWKHEFLVSPDVLIPRPETELLVETSLELLRDLERPLIVDVGTGSGCIALSLAHERPDATVHAIDVSPPALAVARENALRLGLEERVIFHHGDLLAPVGTLSGTVDLILSNPPYVAAEELPGLAPEVHRHEPRLALVSPGDRLTVYRRLARAASELLRPDRRLGVEVGEGMAQEVAPILESAGLRIERILADHAGIARAVIGRRPLG